MEMMMTGLGMGFNSRVVLLYLKLSEVLFATLLSFHVKSIYWCYIRIANLIWSKKLQGDEWVHILPKDITVTQQCSLDLHFQTDHECRMWVINRPRDLELTSINLT